MADILTSNSYQDELYNPHLTTQQSQMSNMQYTNSFQQQQQHQMFQQQSQATPQQQQHPWFEEM